MKLWRITKRIISEPSPFDLELKPGNPTGVRQGMRQLDKYVDRFNLERPLNNGRKWEGVLDLY